MLMYTHLLKAQAEGYHLLEGISITLIAKQEVRPHIYNGVSELSMTSALVLHRATGINIKVSLNTIQALMRKRTLFCYF